MPIDVIVVNYRTYSDLDRFLDSYLRFRPWGSTITMVDVDPVGEGIGTDISGSKRTLTIPENVGYGRACNMAGAIGDGDIIACFNADVVLRPDALERCADALSSRRQWGVLGPKQVDSAGRIRHAGIFGTRAAPAHRGWNARDTGQYAGIEKAVTVSGSAFFIKRDCWNDLTGCKTYDRYVTEEMFVQHQPGPFLPTAHYYEETWVSYHAVEHGWDVIYYGPVTIVHEWHKASPVGGAADRQMPVSQQAFRGACKAHGIPHD